MAECVDLIKGLEFTGKCLESTYATLFVMRATEMEARMNHHVLCAHITDQTNGFIWLFWIICSRAKATHTHKRFKWLLSVCDVELHCLVSFEWLNKTAPKSTTPFFLRLKIAPFLLSNYERHTRSICIPCIFYFSFYIFSAYASNHKSDLCERTLEYCLLRVNFVRFFFQLPLVFSAVATVATIVAAAATACQHWTENSF